MNTAIYVLLLSTCVVKILKIWRRKWQPSPVLLPGESLGQRRPVGYSPWGRKSRIRLSDWHTPTIEILDGARAHFLYSPISCRKQDGAGSTWEAGWLPHPHPFWKSRGLNACNSWPWANKRLSCLLAKKKKRTSNFLKKSTFEGLPWQFSD